MCAASAWSSNPHYCARCRALRRFKAPSRWFIRWYLFSRARSARCAVSGAVLHAAVSCDDFVQQPAVIQEPGT